MATTYKPFSIQDDIILAPKTKIYPMWQDSKFDPDNVQECILTAFYTSSAKNSPTGNPTASDTWDSSYFWNVYQERVDSSSLGISYNANAEPVFSIAYGTSGSYNLYSADDSLRYTYPSHAVYRQMANLLTGQGSDSLITYGTENTPMSASFFIIIARNRLKDGIDPSTFRLNLVCQSPQKHIQLALDTGSAAANQTIFNLVTVPSSSDSVPEYGLSYGIVDVNKGIIALDATTYVWDISDPRYYKLNLWRDYIQRDDISLANGISQYFTPPGEASVDAGYYPFRGMKTIYDMITDGAHFEARSVELANSVHYFVRVKNAEYNTSENPTWRDADGNILSSFKTDPKTFITSVGLYGTVIDNAGNQSKRLIAVAKLNKPIPKDSATEAIIKVRLDF